MPFPKQSAGCRGLTPVPALPFELKGGGRRALRLGVSRDPAEPAWLCLHAGLGVRAGSQPREPAACQTTVSGTVSVALGIEMMIRELAQRMGADLV